MKCTPLILKYGKSYGNGRIILANADAKNAWEIKIFQPIIGSRIQKSTDGYMVMSGSRVLRMVRFFVGIVIRIARVDSKDLEKIKLKGG